LKNEAGAFLYFFVAMIAQGDFCTYMHMHIGRKLKFWGKNGPT